MSYCSSGMGDEMSRSLNKVMIIGHLGRDPEMRYTPSGRPVTTFSVVTNRTWNTSDGERHSEAEWFHVVTWGNLAEICKQNLTRGQQVYIEGRLQTRRWEDSEHVMHASVEIVANEMMIIGERRGNNATRSKDMLDETELTTNEITEEEDDFPF